MKINYYLPVLALTGFFMFSCEDSSKDLQPESNLANSTISQVTLSHPEGTEVINFESFAKGTIVSEAWSSNGIGPVKVWGTNASHPDKNAAMIFDSSNPTGNDFDLGTPNKDFGGPGIGKGGAMGSAYANDMALGKLLIITEDFNSNNPDDADLVGSKLMFDFSGLSKVSVYSMHVIDVESVEPAATVMFYDAEGKMIGSHYSLPKVGDNGVANFKFGEGVSNVAKMVVTLNGSGAIDNIVFKSEQEESMSGCTYTQGYWKTHSKYGSAKKRNATWDKIGSMGEDTKFFMTEHTYMHVMMMEPKGNAYFILAHQYIAAKLNVLNGTSAPEEVKTAIMEAEAMFMKYTPADIEAMKSSDPVRMIFIKMAETLDKYNNGLIGPGHCK